MEHHWSGWPGAWCFHCHRSDPVEMDLADRIEKDVDDYRNDPRMVCPGVCVKGSCPQYHDERGGEG